MQNNRKPAGSAGKNWYSSTKSDGKKPFYSSSSRGGGRNAGKRVNPGERIDINKFISTASTEIEQKPVVITHKFTDFGFGPEIELNLKKKNYVTPTPIQDQTMSHIMDGRDIIGLANTGTGKTAAFLLPLINKVVNDRSQKVLIIAPTRELAIQIENELRQFSWGMKIFFATCVGGLPIYSQINNLRRNPNFVIGTPGRLKDLSNKNVLHFETFNNIVLDEVDRMLDMGFVDEIRSFLAQLPAKRQSLFFSATMPPKIRDLVGTFLIDPITVKCSTGETAKNVEQDIVKFSHKSEKFSKLQILLNQPELTKVLIFGETKREVERLTTDLNDRGFKAESIHGDKRQGQRQRALTQFKNSHVDILVATDVAARGLDIKDITHVVNYTVPQSYEDYIHRIGRTGRGESKGKALTFVEAR